MKAWLHSIKVLIYRKWYLRTRYWRWIKACVKIRADFQCQIEGCDANTGYMDVHHTTYKIWFFSILFLEWLFLDKMIYLCREHHILTHGHITLQLKDGRTLRPYGHKFPKGANYV